MNKEEFTKTMQPAMEFLGAQYGDHRMNGAWYSVEDGGDILRAYCIECGSDVRRTVTTIDVDWEAKALRQEFKESVPVNCKEAKKLNLVKDVMLS